MRTGSTGNSTTCRRAPREIAVVAPNWLGDAVMATPLLAALRARFPEARVTVACRPYVAAIFRGHPCVDALAVYEDAGVRARMRSMRAARPAGGYDVCFVLPPSFAGALVALASGARRRVGYRGEWRAALLTDSLPRRGYRSVHLSTAYGALLARYAGEPAGETPLPRVEPPARWRETARRVCGEGPYAVLAAGAVYGSSKVWPAAHFSELARRLAAGLELRSIVVGNAAEREGAERIAVSSGKAAESRAGALSLEELLAVLAGARIVVGNDSGPVHAAAALGTPTVAVFGPTSVDWTAPRGRAVRIVRAAIECAPCFRRECPHGHPECLERVSAHEAYDAVRSVIDGG